MFCSGEGHLGYLTVNRIGVRTTERKLLSYSFLLFFYVTSAADWKLDEPAWTGRMKITAKGKLAYIKLEDRNTGAVVFCMCVCVCFSVLNMGNLCLSAINDMNLLYISYYTLLQTTLPPVIRLCT